MSARRASMARLLPLLLLLLLPLPPLVKGAAAAAAALAPAVAADAAPRLPRRSLLQQQQQPRPAPEDPPPPQPRSSGLQNDEEQGADGEKIDGRTLSLAGAPASSGDGAASRRAGFTADGFPFGFGGLGPLNLGPGGFGPQIYETIFGSNLNTGSVSSVSQATSNLAGPDAGGPLRDALFAALPESVRGALGADIVSLVGYDAGDRLLGRFATLGSGAAVGQKVPAGCIGPIFTLSLNSGACTVDDGDEEGGGEGGGDKAGGGNGGNGGGGDKGVSKADDGDDHQKKKWWEDHHHKKEPAPPRAGAKVTCGPPSASFVATPLSCNLPYRSAATLVGPSIGGAAFPLAPARALDLFGAPLAFGAGAALNVTRLYLGYSAGTRRLLNDLGVYRWYNYAGQVAAAELLRIQAAIIAGATPPLRTTSAGRLAGVGGIGGGIGGLGGLGGVGLFGRGGAGGVAAREFAGNSSSGPEEGGQGDDDPEAPPPPPPPPSVLASAAAAATGVARELMQREADALPPLLRGAAAALAGAAAATRGGSDAVAGAREVAEAADELGRRIAARLGAAPGGGGGGTAALAQSGSGVALLSALARGDLAGVRRALERSPAQRRAAADEASAAAAVKGGADAAADAAGAARGEAGAARSPAAAAAAANAEEAPAPYMTAREQQALVMGADEAESAAGSGNPYRRHVAQAAGDGPRAGTGQRLARSTAAEAADGAAGGGGDAGAKTRGAPRPLQTAAERAQSALDPLSVSSEDVATDVIRAIMKLSAPPAEEGGQQGAGPPPAPAGLVDAPPSADLGEEKNPGLLSDGPGLAEAVAAETARGATEGGAGGGEEVIGGGSGSDVAAAGDRRRRRQQRRR